MILSSHCISHRFPLSTKSEMEKNNKSLKDLFQFVAKLFKYHHNSANSSNGTRWISQFQLALKNLLNVYNGHVQTYNELQQAKKFLAVSKLHSLYFSHKLSNRQFMEFALFMIDVVNSLSIFSKVSHNRNTYCTSVNNSLQKCLIKLGEFNNDPNCGENWKKQESIIGKSANGIVRDKKFRQLVVQQLRLEIKDRCNDLPMI